MMGLRCRSAQARTQIRSSGRAGISGREHIPHSTTTRAGTETPSSSSSSSSSRRIVILGGAGRVGSATAAAILREQERGNGFEGREVVLAGRRPREEALSSLPQDLAGRVGYERCDASDPASLDRLLGSPASLVIHAAGPFQQTESCPVLEASIRNGCGAYLDVCDDADHTLRAKTEFHDAAREAGLSAVVSTGVYPGLSNVMAAYMCRGAGSPFPDSSAEKLRYSYFTAGSGGVGETILATSVLLLGEPAAQFVEGQRRDVGAYSERNVVEFGQKVGKRECFSLNLPEVFTSREALGVETVSAYFGTSPGVWNLAMRMMADLLPRDLLRSRKFANALAGLIMPLVVAVDALVGKTTAMRVDVKYQNGKASSSLFVHGDTAAAAGNSAAAFADRLLRDEDGEPLGAGVWYPEDDGVVEDHDRFFRMCTEGCQAFAMSQAPWRLEQDGLRIGMGLYL